MQIEIHKPELEQRVLRRIQSGQYHDVDELLTQALDALDAKAVASPEQQRDGHTGADLIAALQSSPYPEIDLTPPRVPIRVRDVEL